MLFMIYVRSTVGQNDSRRFDEEIYIEQLNGHVVFGQERKVSILVKSLYGLKQVPKQWHAKFDSVMITNNFKINECGKCISFYNLGIQIKGSSEGLVLTQSHFVDKILEKFDKNDFGISRTLIETSQNLSKNKGKLLINSRQTLITRSTMKSQFVVLDKSREEFEWLHNFLKGISEWPKLVPTICIYCDNQETIGGTQIFMYNGKSRPMWH
ncbi:hypothetical protein GQ457_01G012880 [Hibiscus cannabinus]